MQSIDSAELEKLSDTLKSVLDEAPEKKRDLHEQLAELAKQEVDSQISASLGGDSGKIAEWQETHVGSGGGYAAIRASSESTGANSPGAITNYLENGHTIRSPSGHAQHYKPAIHEPYVEGRHFYQASRSALESKAIAAAQRFADQMAERIEHG